MPKWKDESQPGILKCKIKTLWLRFNKTWYIFSLRVGNTSAFQVPIETWPYTSPQKNLNTFPAVDIIQTTFFSHNTIKQDLLTLSQNKGPCTQTCKENKFSCILDQEGYTEILGNHPCSWIVHQSKSSIFYFVK